MKQQSIEKAPIQYFPLDQLYLSPMNPREGVDAEGIALLAESIKAAGLIQNLAGHPDPDGRVGNRHGVRQGARPHRRRI